MPDSTEPDREEIRARLAAAGLTTGLATGLAMDDLQLDRLAEAAGRLARFARLNRLGEDLLDEPAFSFDLPPRGAPDER